LQRPEAQPPVAQVAAAAVVAILAQACGERSRTNGVPVLVTPHPREIARHLPARPFQHELDVLPTGFQCLVEACPERSRRKDRHGAVARQIPILHGLLSGGGGSDLKRGDLAIEATALTEEEATLLHSDVGVPGFRLEHIFYDFKDCPVSWGWFICAGDRLRFTATVGIRD
jgi:DNA-binding GntR family transcriptional regulator